ncbi:MAG TPA: formate dehydrogenase accessory protein FdhE [Vicinamibacterales bacterium]|nr:formate dehydrogenase accessory protein FdhE [Vicinamibacterales bacterium]
MSEPRLPTPPQRSESREIAELRRLKQEQPDLASAADLQIELLQLQRRVQSRVSLPSIRLDKDSLNAQLASAPVLHFDHLPLEWGELRFLLRATASAMRSHGALEERDFRRIEALCRDSEKLPVVMRSWYEAAKTDAPPIHPEGAGLESVFVEAMKPFLTRSADAIMAKSDFAGWTRGVCPLCAGEPDFAVITPAADRILICGRCLARWRFHQLTCPFCLNADRERITSFASRDGQYRLYACDECERYLKAYDARRASRPVMPSVDAVATLPLDAAAIQKGYK